MNIPQRFAYLAVFIAVCGHASSEFVAVLTGVAGPELSVWRYLLGGFGLVVAAIAVSGFKAFADVVQHGGLGLLGVSVYGVAGAYLAFHWALDFASPVQIAILVTTIPIWVGLANWKINGQALSWLKVVTAVFAFCGLVLLITDGALDQLRGERDSLIGIGLSLICAALASIYAVQIKPYVSRHGALLTTAVSLMFAGGVLWLGVGLVWGDWVNPASLFATSNVENTASQAGCWILVLAFWNTTVTQLLWIGGLAAAADMTRASYLFFLKPIIAAILALAFLSGTEISALQWAAIAIVTTSVVVEMLWDRYLRSKGTPTL
ncbi:MAG: DMT family transporter [Hyphomicrobiaceae bacterium]